jgi:hypothetical protein
VRDEWGDTFFIWACRWGHTEAVLRAIEQSDDEALQIHTYEEGKRSPLELAVIGRHRDIVMAIVRCKYLYFCTTKASTFVLVKLLTQWHAACGVGIDRFQIRGARVSPWE